MKHLGYPTRQCLERWLAADHRYAGHMAKPIIPPEARTKTIELVLGGMQQKQAAERLDVSIGAIHNWVKAYREGGMAALQPRNRNASHANKPAPRRSRNAVAISDDAEAFASSKGRYGYRKIKAMLRTLVSEKVIRRIMAEGDFVAHVPRSRRYSSYKGETTPAPGNLINRDFTAKAPNEKRLTDITEIKARDGKAYLSPMIDCHDGRIVAYATGFSPNVELANGMLVKAAETLPEGGEAPGAFQSWVPLPVARMAGAHGTVRPDAGSMSAKVCSPDNAAAEGFFGRMKTESVCPGHWEERTCDEVLVLIDDYIQWYSHGHIKRSLGWMSPVQYRQSQETAA